MFDKALLKVLSETAEQMFFQEFEPQPTPSLPAQLVAASVAVLSPPPFEVIVAAEAAQLQTVAQELFADGKADEDRLADVVSELANTIAGSLSRHFTMRELLFMSPPRRMSQELPGAVSFHSFKGEGLTLFIAVKEVEEAA